MSKTVWRQTDIRDFLCQHNWSRSKEAHVETVGRGFGIIKVGYKCHGCGMIINERSYKVGNGSIN